jgi:hypothetical protein
MSHKPPRGASAGSVPAARAATAYDPRIINPVRFSRAVIFAADEDVRAAGDELAERMPWTKVEVATDPLSLDRIAAGQAAAFVFDDTGLIVADTDRLRSSDEDRVFILLSGNEVIHRTPPSIMKDRYPYTAKADLIFAVDRDEFIPRRIITPAVRSAEDLLNIRKYAKERRFIFLIVDDEPLWFSQFLPVLYGIIGQRADVMIARTYEEALRFLFGVDHESEVDRARFLSRGHGDDVIGLIADLYFPKGGDMDSPVGQDLIEIVKIYYPRIPVIVASRAKEAQNLKDRALILPKGDPGSLETLKDYIHDFTGMGDLVIHNPDGSESHRLRDIFQLRELLIEAGQDSKRGATLRKTLELYAEKDAFSTWFYMHGFRTLGDILRPRQDRDFELVNELRKFIDEELARIRSTPLVIEEERIFDLHDLLRVLKHVDPQRIQPLSDNDVFSTWLDSKAYPELAEEFRPIHGSGERLREALAGAVEKWIKIYRSQGKPV